jgi:hypothetical protein
MRKHVSWTVAASALLLAAGCGGANTGYDASAPMAAPEPEMTKAIEAFEATEAVAEAPADGGAAGGEAPVQQYIAYAHSVGIRLPVATIEPTMQAHVAACNSAGPSVCVVTNSWFNSQTEDYSNANLELRATPAWIETFLSGIEAEAEAARGEVFNRQTLAEDLTVTIIDTDARLKSQILLQKRVEDLLADRPGNLGELLETQRELARVNGEIDSLTSTLAALRQRVDMSRLSVSYETKVNPISGGALSPLGDAFSNFFYNFAGALAAVVNAFAYSLPWLLLIGALLWIWLRLIWPRIRRKKPPVA